MASKTEYVAEAVEGRKLMIDPRIPERMAVYLYHVARMSWSLHVTARLAGV